MAAQQGPRLNNSVHRMSRWSLAFVVLTALLVLGFAVLATLGYKHVQDLTIPRDDAAWIISQVSYEHERLLLAAETDASQAALRLRGDIYLSRVDLLRKAPIFAALREAAPQDGLDALYASVESTDRLIDGAVTPQGHQVLLNQLRTDSGPVREQVLKLSTASYGIITKNLAGHATDVLHYIVAFGALMILAICLSTFTVIIINRNIKLEAQKDRADDASKMKSQFLSNMSHEIRTPLNGIIGTLNLIENEPLSRGNKESIDIVKRSSRTLLEIVNSILDFSKIEAGEISTTSQWFDTRILVADILSHNAGLINERNIDLLVQFDDGLPSNMYSDRLKLEQILNNLFSNALKFTDAGSVTLKVRRSGNLPSNAGRKGAIEFVISDTGIGISETDQARLFEPFRQIDGSLTRRYKGTGLGLSIARSLAEKLGGTVTLTSKAGVGTSAKVLIPQSVLNEPVSTGPHGAGATRGAPEIVLLGEYSTIFRASLALAQIDKTVHTIRSEEEAEAFLLSPPESVRAIVTDRRFGGDAIAWINRVAEAKSLKIDLPIIIIRGTKTYGPGTGKLPVYEIEGRFSHSSFLEALQEAVPSMGLNHPQSKAGSAGNGEGALALIERLSVLVVDDNSINRRILVRLLNNAGVTDVESVPGAIEALKCLEQKHFDLVFMDIQMPEIDGYMATRMIRDRGYRDTRIFACSAHAFDMDIRRSLDEGLDGHISKPLEAAELMALLKEAVVRSEQHA